MREFLHSVAVLFRKEIRIILKDPRSRFILVVPILIQSLLFGYVATYDLNTVLYAVLDQDHSDSSRELVSHFEGSPIFHRVATLGNSSQIAPLVDGKKAEVVIHIGPGFEQKLTAGQTVPVQVIVDGRNGNVAGIASSYADSIIRTFSAQRLMKQGINAETVSIMPRSWFNPNLETRWNFVSGMLIVLACVQVLMLTALTVAREREQGTFDQLLVTPFGPMVILMGKALPSVCIGLVQSAVVLAIALYWFHIPFAGSYFLLFAGLTLANLALVGIGLCISTLTYTMQQAMLYAFSLLMPMILLSGFVTSISSMPVVLQYGTLINPVRYGVEITQRIYLEGATFRDLSASYLALFLISFVTLATASRLFRGRV